MFEKLYQIRAELADFHKQLQQGMDWYKQEMDKLQNELHTTKHLLEEKEKEIAELKQKCNSSKK